MHHPPIHAPRFHPEIQLSAVRLSIAEEAGNFAVALGLRGERSHRPPRSQPVGPESVRYIWPAPTGHHPHARRSA